MNAATRAATLISLLAGVAAAAPAVEDVLVLRHSSDVRAIHRQGDLLWVGTGGGLYAYDLSTEQWTDRYVTGARLPSGSIRSIAARNDTIFVATDAGLSLVVEGDVIPYEPRGRGRFERVRAIDFGVDETLFLATYGYGVTVVRGGTSWRVTREDSLLDNKVYGVVQEEDSTTYYATSMGLCAFRDSVWVNFQAGAGIPRGEVRQIIPSGAVGYYLLVEGRGVYTFNGYRARKAMPDDVFPGDVVACIALDAGGRLWAGARYGGVAVREDGRWRRVGIGDARVDGQEWSAAHADGFGTVYFGAKGGGVIAVADDRVRAVATIDRALPTGRVSGLVVDPHGGVLFLCAKRVFGVGGQAPAKPRSFGPAGINALAFAPDSSLWLAGRWGVHRFDAARSELVEFPVDARGTDPAFVSLDFDDDGHLWVSERRGDVYRFDGELWMRLGDTDNTGGLEWITLVAGSAGGMWAVADSGCGRYRGGKWRLYPDTHLIDLRRAPSGAMTGVSPHGLVVYDSNGGWRPVAFGTEGGERGIEQQLGRDRGTALAFDAGGRVYLGTTDGVVVVGPDGSRRWRGVDGIGGKAVADLVIEGNQWLWVGFERDGLARIPLRSLW